MYRLSWIGWTGDYYSEYYDLASEAYGEYRVLIAQGIKAWVEKLFVDFDHYDNPLNDDW